MDQHNSPKHDTWAVRKRIFALAPGLAAADQLFRGIPQVLFCIKDTERRYVAANDAFVAATSVMKLSEVIGYRASDVFPTLLAASYEQQDDEVFASRDPIDDRLEMITRADGTTGWFVSQKIPVASATGEIVALACASRDLHTPAIDGGEIGPLATALETIHREFNRPLQIGELARKTGLSWSQFQRRVSAITGLAPRQLLTKLRVEAAAKMLRRTEEPLSVVAAETGFYDQSALSRHFRSFTGISPGQYRTAMREIEPPRKDA